MKNGWPPSNDPVCVQLVVWCAWFIVLRPTLFVCKSTFGLKHFFQNLSIISEPLTISLSSYRI